MAKSLYLKKSDKYHLWLTDLKIEAIIIVILRNKSILVIAFLGRLLLSLLIHFQLIKPPVSDQIAMLRQASEWKSLGWLSLSEKLIPDHSYVHSAVGAFLYKIVGEVPLVLTLFNVFLGTLLVALTFELAKNLVGRRRANIVVWIAALFPPALIYSSVFIREVWGSVPFMLGLINVVHWQQKESKHALFNSIAFFSLASFFHGAYAISLAVLLALSGKDILIAIYALKPRISNQKFITTIVAVVILGAMIIGAIASNTTLGSIGDVSKKIEDPTSAIEEQSDRANKGGSAFPTIITDQFWLFPVRVIYFLFSPFPWDIRSISHIQGFIATAVYSYIAVSIYKSRRSFRGRKDIAIVFAITITMILVFTAGTGNIGTSIRHRTKFLYPLLALCASPVFKPIGWGKKHSSIVLR